MSTIETYLNILIDSLNNKIKYLNRILELTKKQEELIKNTELDLDSFEKIMDEKTKHIEAIEVIDAGFQSTFDRIKDILTNQTNIYANELKQLKEKIALASDVGISIQVLEERNKINIQRHFSGKKTQVKNFKKSRATAANYYKSMNKMQPGQSYFMDQKK